MSNRPAERTSCASARMSRINPARKSGASACRPQSPAFSSADRGEKQSPAYRIGPAEVSGGRSNLPNAHLLIDLLSAQQPFQFGNPCLKRDRRWSLTTLREKLVKIGAKVVRHGRYVTFQLAEVAVPRNLFQKILSLIDDLRRRPVLA